MDDRKTLLPARGANLRKITYYQPRPDTLLLGSAGLNIYTTGDTEVENGHVNAGFVGSDDLSGHKVCSTDDVLHMLSAFRY